MKQLTKAEEEVMQLLWQLEKANVAAIIKELPEPKPAYNTVSTIVRILEDKGFVSHEKVGKSMVAFFMKKNDISLAELESIMGQIKEEEE
jgi:predicted transcriptional regulator